MTTEQYTPTTDEVRLAFVEFLRGEATEQGLTPDRQTFDIIAGLSFDRWLAKVRAEARAEADQAFIAWLVDQLHYPFDMSFTTPPPIDIDALADHWNRSDGWGLSDEDARACVREEAGIDRAKEQS